MPSKKAHRFVVHAQCFRGAGGAMDSEYIRATQHPESIRLYLKRCHHFTRQRAQCFRFIGHDLTGSFQRGATFV
jgi:hypothetical protein